MPDTYTLTPLAYALPILHSAQYPSSTTLGLLLANGTDTDITDAIPLQHLNTSLSPYTELGLELVTAHAESKGLKVVGMYVAHENEKGQGSGLGRIGEKILTKLGAGAGGFGVGLVLNNERLGNGEGAFDIYLSNSPTKAIPHSSSSSSALPSPISLDPTIPAKVLKAIREGKVHQLIKDLDNHLEDSSVDWLDNKEAKEALRKFL